MIVDDEPLAVKLLESFVTKTPDLELLGSFTDSVEAINAVKEQKPNLLFLDIQMPDLNGMELAHMIPSETRVIFTTAFKEYAFESYEVSALDFLLKPIRYNKFLAAVEKAREWFKVYSLEFKDDYPASPEGPTDISPINYKLSTQNSKLSARPEGALSSERTINSTLFLKVDGEYRQVALSQIIYVCGMKDYVMFYLDGERKPLITHLTMKAVEDMLPTEIFMRVNRSYIVALDKIRKIDRNDCIYIGEEGTSAEIIRVTEAYRETFLQYLQSKFPGAK